MPRTKVMYLFDGRKMGAETLQGYVQPQFIPDALLLLLHELVPARVSFDLPSLSYGKANVRSKIWFQF